MFDHSNYAVDCQVTGCQTEISHSVIANHIKSAAEDSNHKSDNSQLSIQTGHPQRMWWKY